MGWKKVVRLFEEAWTCLSLKTTAELAVRMLESAFAKVTGAQVAVDGGNERVI
ncbi:MAG: hypothetical protein AAB316_09045 [Bacteroidota bacterium]